MIDVGQMFEPLRQLFRGDDAKVRRVLGIFQDVARGDLQGLRAACAAGDRAQAGRLAHKMKSAFLQVGETAAADALVALEHKLGAGLECDTFAAELSAVLAEVEDVQARVEAYLSTGPGARAW